MIINVHGEKPVIPRLPLVIKIAAHTKIALKATHRAHGLQKIHHIGGAFVVWKICHQLQNIAAFISTGGKIDVKIIAFATPRKNKSRNIFIEPKHRFRIERGCRRIFEPVIEQIIVERRRIGKTGFFLAPKTDGRRSVPLVLKQAAHKRRALFYAATIQRKSLNREEKALHQNHRRENRQHNVFLQTEKIPLH